MRTLPSLLERGAGGSLSRGRTPGENGSRRGLTGSGARHAVDDAQQVRAAREGHVSLSRAPRRQRGTVLLQEVDQPPERLEALPLVARGDTRVQGSAWLAGPRTAGRLLSEDLGDSQEPAAYVT